MSQKPSLFQDAVGLLSVLPPPEMASDVLTSLPGASVTLTCPGEDLGDNATVQWVLMGSQHRRWAGVGRRLLLRSVQHNDSGNYSCYLDGHPAGTVQLLVDGELSSELFDMPMRSTTLRILGRFLA